MNPASSSIRLIAAAVVIAMAPAAAWGVIVYSTDFEEGEGYSLGGLNGQQSWTADADTISSLAPEAASRLSRRIAAAAFAAGDGALATTITLLASPFSVNVRPLAGHEPFPSKSASASATADVAFIRIFSGFIVRT